MNAFDGWWKLIPIVGTLVIVGAVVILAIVVRGSEHADHYCHTRGLSPVATTGLTGYVCLPGAHTKPY